MTEKRDKVNVDDIVGLIKTDEPTDSVEEVRKLRGRDDNNFYWYKKYKEVLNENEQLKLQYKEVEISLLNNQLAYNDLEKENEQLKQDLKIIVEHRKQETEYTARLEEKNEQLKKEVESKQRVINAYEQYINDLKEDGVIE